LDTSGTKTEGACKDGASEMEVYTVNNKNHLKKIKIVKVILKISFDLQKK